MTNERADEKFLRRHIEEFFDLKADIRHLPLGSSSLAGDLSYQLNAPGTKEPLEKFFDGLIYLPSIEGVAIIIDTWNPDNNGIPNEVFMYWYFVLNQMCIPNSPKAISVVEYTGKGLMDIKRVYDSTQKSSFNSGAYFSLIPKGENFNSVVASIIKRSFEKNPGYFGMNRVEDEPPSAFFVAKIDR